MDRDYKPHVFILNLWTAENHYYNLTSLKQIFSSLIFKHGKIMILEISIINLLLRSNPSNTTE